MPRVMINMDAVRAALDLGDSSPVYGLRRDTEGLVQVLSAYPEDRLEPVGVAVRVAPDGPSTVVPLGSAFAWLTFDHPIAVDTEVDLVEFAEGLDSRRTGSATLRDKSAAIYGVGTLGACMALSLAQAGVGTITVIDKDVVDASNVSRHACDLFDVGRRKVDAVADLLRRRGATVVPVDADVSTMSERELDAICVSADVVGIVMDSPPAQFAVNESCVRTGTSGVAPAAYELACAGESVCVRPGHGPCLYCATGFRTGLAPAVAVSERRQAYQAADANRLVAEPGLAADIASIATVATAYALAILDPMGSRASLLDPAKAFALVHGGSMPRPPYSDLFLAPFDLVFAQVIRDEPCPVCGWMTRG